MTEPVVRSNQISGIVRHKETKQPLKNLIVTAYDLDPSRFNPDSDQIGVQADPSIRLNDPRKFVFEGRDPIEPGGGTLPQAFPDGVPGDRLGSVMTDEYGHFEIVYDDDDFRIRSREPSSHKHGFEARPDLFLIVTSAEEASSDQFQNVVFHSNWARINAGRVETYLIEIDGRSLESHNLGGLVETSEQQAIQSGIDEKSASLIRQLKIERGLLKSLRSVNEEIEQEESEEKRNVRDTLRSSFFQEVRHLNENSDLVRFIEAGESIETPQEEVFDTGVKRIEAITKSNAAIPGEGVKITVYLSERDLETFSQFEFEHEGSKYLRIPESELATFLFKREEDQGVNAILFSNNPISQYCRNKSMSQECSDILDPEQELALPDAQEDDILEELEQDNEIQKEQIPQLLSTVMFPRSSDIFSESELMSERPTAASVQSSVDSFMLQKGPADATAFYDFESLNIAFPHVWKQLVDESLVELGERAHFGLVKQGKKGLVTNNLAVNASAFNFPTFVVEEINWDRTVPAVISKSFDISQLEYDAMTEIQKGELQTIAARIDALNESADPFFDPPKETKKIGNTSGGMTVVHPSRKATYDEVYDRIETLFDQGEMLLENVRLDNPNSTNALMKELHERLKSKHEFTIFAADKNGSSVNFGLLNTYRQKWEPVSYQAGQLAKTITMAPKQEVKVSVETKRKLKSAEQEAQNANSSLSSASDLTSRSESEIIAKAQKKSEFDLNVDARYGQSSVKLGLGKDAARDSSEAKKSFRESVLKAAQEFKDEWSIDVSTEEEFDVNESTVGTIVNPNDELSVTYLFYQLQRRYRVSEQLYRTSPVVLVAQEVPAPHEITEGWVIAHDWIINRVLLDDSFRPALDIMSSRNVGNAHALRELRKNLREQRRLMRSLEREFAKLQLDMKEKYRDFQVAVSDRIDTEHYRRNRKYYRGWWFGRRRREGVDGEELDITDFDPEMAKALEQSASEDYQHAVEQAKRLSMSVQRESRTLQELTREYNDAMEEHLNLRVSSKRLLTHIKENILHYMQAIWRMEPTDQRFMRLHKVKVPDFTATRTCVVSVDPSPDLFSKFRKDGKTRHDAWLSGEIDAAAGGELDIKYRALVEMADLDTLLGFKGNYMIFPLKNHNAITEFMAAPYIDEAFGAMDPDQLSNINLEEYSDYICCLREEDPELFDELKPVLREFLSQLLANPLRNGDEIIVPTDSLFIEMLPSENSLLEDFKLRHRAMDVMKVRAEVRQMELENVRYAARLLEEEYSEPDTEKKILVQGNPGAIITD